MIDGFLALPPIVIITICIAVPVALAAVVTWLIFSGKIASSDEDSGMLEPLVTFTGTAFALLLAFVIVNVWTDQVEKQDVLFAEVTTIENILVEIDTIDADAESEIEAAFKEYLDSMLENEIREKPPIGGAEHTNQKFEQVLKLIDQEDRKLAADDATRAEAAGLFEETREFIRDREERVNKAAAELDTTFTAIMVLLALLTVASVALLPSTSSKWSKWAQSVGVAVSVGLVMSLVFYVASDRFTRDAEEEQIVRVEDALKSE